MRQVPRAAWKSRKIERLPSIINDFVAGYLCSGERMIVGRSIKNFTHDGGSGARLNERDFARVESRGRGGGERDGASEKIKYSKVPVALIVDRQAGIPWFKRPEIDPPLKEVARFEIFKDLRLNFDYFVRAAGTEKRFHLDAGSRRYSTKRCSVLFVVN